MNKPLFMVFLACASVLPARVTLSQAVRDAWALSHTLDSQKQEEAAAAVARLTALRQKYFSVLFGGSYRYSSDKVEVKAADFTFSLGPDVPAGAIILSAPSDNFDVKFSLQQPLYAGGVLSNAVRMEAAREAAEKDLTRLKKIELAGAVKSSYFNYLLYCKKRDSMNCLLSGLEIHLKKVESLYGEELVRRSDVLETQAKADEVRLSLEDLEQLIAAEGVHFSSLCGHDPQDVDFQAGGVPLSLATAREALVAGHPLLRSLDERARMARIQRRSVSGSYLPQVSAFAEMHYGKPGQNFFLDRWTFYVTGGVSVSMPVFNWNRRGRDLELADIALRKIEDQRADFLRESEKGLRQLFIARDSLGRKRSLLDRLVASAGEELRLKEKLYEENQIDHADLLAAMTGQEKYLAEREGLAAQLELLAASIDTLIGKCEEEE
jgi:outer membrane protein TolC